ncbi:MAG: hypothetical protein IPF93_14805 [Saprospiraceae bacterium]|nr:hypothetical protein [Saprospiraceae bacterium]
MIKSTSYEKFNPTLSLISGSIPMDERPVRRTYQACPATNLAWKVL